MKILATTLLCLAATATAGAQTVWRCGADGRGYADTPCPHQGRALEAPAARPAEDVAQAREAARREQAHAEALARERRVRESSVVPAHAAGIGGRAALPPVKAKAVTEKLRSAGKAKHRLKKPPTEAAGTSRAVAPSSRQTTG